MSDSLALWERMHQKDVFALTFSDAWLFLELFHLQIQ